MLTSKYKKQALSNVQEYHSAYRPVHFMRVKFQVDA
jgi:hypothetical protein